LNSKLNSFEKKYPPLYKKTMCHENFAIEFLYVLILLKKVLKQRRCKDSLKKELLFKKSFNDQ